MANIIENLIYDGSLDVDFSNLQIKIKINGEEKNVKIGALWFKDGANFSQLSSLEQFDKFKGKSLFVKTLEGKYAKVSISSKPEIFYSSAASVRPKITTNIIKPTKQQVVSFEEQVAGTMKTVQKDIELQHGAKRTYLADINNKLTTDDTYIMIKIKGHKQPTYVKKSEIIYDNSSTVKTLLDLMNLKKADLEEFIKNNRFYYKGTLIEGISTAYEYSCEELLSYEELDVEHATKKTVELKQNAKISSGKITYEIANESTVSLDPYYSDQHYVKKEEQEGNDPEKKTEVAKIQIRNAKLAQDGEFIKVVIAGEMAHTLVKLSDIYDLHSNTQITDLTQLGGQAVRIKQADGTFVTTEPLTYEQVSLRYDTIKSFQPAPEDMQPMAEEAYLKLSNGKYIKEAEAVKPLVYKYVIDENTNNFDIYRVKVLDSNPPQYVLVTKEFVEKQAVINPTTESGAKLDLGDCRKMQRTPDLKTCDVIQTSSAGKDVEACKILPPVNTAARRAELSDSMRAFETGYKNGTYKLTSVYNKDNQLCTLDKSSAKRFVFTDTFEIEDKAERSIEYKSMKFNKLIFDERKGKNGTFTAVTGGPEFSFKNATSEGYKNLGKIFGATFAASMNPAGIFAILAFYPVVALGLAGMVAAIPGIPIVNAFRKLKNIIKPDKLKEKVEIQRKEDKKEIELLLENLLETSKKQEMTAENILKMDQRFEEINQRIIALSRANVNTKFQIVNGQCEITTDMAPFVIEYKRQHKKDFKNLNKTEAQIAKKEKSVAEYKKELAALEKQKGQLKAEKYEKLLKKLHKKYGDDPVKHLAEMKKDFSEARTKYDSEMAYFVTSSQEKETASFRDELNKKSNNMQAFLYLKYAYKNKDQIRDAKINVEAIDQEKLKDIEFDLTTGQLLYKNKSFEHYDKKEKNTDQDRALLAVFKNIEDAMKAIVEKGITIKQEEIIEKPHEQEGAVFEPAIIEEQEEMVVAEDILEDALEEEQEFDINPIEEDLSAETKAEIDRLQNSILEKESKINEIDSKISECNEEDRVLSRDIKGFGNQIDNMESQLSDLKAYLNAIEEQKNKSLLPAYRNVDNIEKEIEALEKDIDKCRQDPAYIDKIRKEQEFFKGATNREVIESLENELQTQKKQLKFAQEEALEEIARQSEYRNNVLLELVKSKGLSEDIVYASDPIKAMNDMIDEIKAQKAEAEQKQKDNNKNLSALEEEKAKLEAEKGELYEQLRKINSGQTLPSRNKNVDELREELKNSNNAIQTLQNDVNARQAAVEKLNAEKKKLEDKIKDLKKSLKDENKNNKELTKELENLNKQLEQAKKDYDDTKALLKKAKEEKEALNVKIADLEKENKNLTEQNQLAEEKLEKLEAYKQKFEDIKVEKEKLEAEKKKIQEDLTKTIEERNSEISKLKDKISKLDEKLTDYKEKIAKLKEENKNLKSSNEALEKEKKELKGKIDKLNSKVDEIIKEKEALEKDLRAQLADAKSEAEQTKIKLKEKEKAIDALNNELTELKADFEKMTQENADLKEQNAQKDNQIRLIEERLKAAQLLAMQERLAREKLEEENKRKQDELQKLKDKRQQQIKSLEKDVDGLKNAISNIKAQIKLKEQELKQINDNIALSGNNEAQLKLINKEIEVYNKARKSIISAIDNVYTDLLRCEGVAEGLISQADDLDKATLKAIVKQIRSIMNDSVTQTKIVENLATKKIKFENNINTKLNSEQKLKDLLESKDHDLLDYLQREGVSIADADIKAVIARIDKRHQAGAAAMQNAANLKNKNINDILTVGQEYITEILAKGNDLSV